MADQQKKKQNDAKKSDAASKQTQSEQAEHGMTEPARDSNEQDELGTPDPNAKAEAAQRPSKLDHLAETEDELKAEQDSGGAAAGGGAAAFDQAEDYAKDVEAESAEEYEPARREVDASIRELQEELGALDRQDALGRVRRWAAENPALAVVAAAAGGILLGRLVGFVLRPFRKDPLPVRARKRTQALAVQAQEGTKRRAEQARHELKKAQHVAGRRSKEAGEALSERLETTRKRAKTAGEGAAVGTAALGAWAAKKAHDLGEEADHKLNEVSKKVAGSEVGRRTEKLRHEASEKARAAGKDAKHSAGHAKKTLQRKARHGRNVWSVTRTAAKTALAAAILKKTGDVLRRIT